MSAPLTPLQRQGHWSFANSLGLLILRLVIGGTFLYTGSYKLFGGIDGFAQGLSHMNLPLFSPTIWAWIAACGEFFGGLFVLLGLLTRLAAFPIIATMLVAIIKVHGPNGFAGIQLADPPGAIKQGYMMHLIIIAVCIQLILSGAGLLSLDALFFKRSLWARGPQPLDQPHPRT
jgi:putative oxidoreductase